jgi:hypothetical protein
MDAALSPWRLQVVVRSRRHVVWWVSALREAIAANADWAAVCGQASAMADQQQQQQQQQVESQGKHSQKNKRDQPRLGPGPEVYGAFSGTVGVTAEEASALHNQQPSVGMMCGLHVKNPPSQGVEQGEREVMDCQMQQRDVEGGDGSGLDQDHGDAGDGGCIHKMAAAAVAHIPRQRSKIPGVTRMRNPWDAALAHLDGGRDDSVGVTGNEDDDGSSSDSSSSSSASDVDTAAGGSGEYDSSSSSDSDSGSSSNGVASHSSSSDTDADVSLSEWKRRRCAGRNAMCHSHSSNRLASASPELSQQLTGGVTKRRAAAAGGSGGDRMGGGGAPNAAGRKDEDGGVVEMVHPEQPGCNEVYVSESDVNGGRTADVRAARLLVVREGWCS